MSINKNILSIAIILLLLAVFAGCSPNSNRKSSSSNSSNPSKSNESSSQINSTGSSSDANSSNSGVTVINTAETSNNSSGGLQDVITAAENKVSPDFVHFSSSDNGLDNFLNDFLDRNLRYDNQSLGTNSLGGGVMYEKEWETMCLTWFDSTSKVLPDDRYQILKSSIDNIPIDKYGYVWQASDGLQPDNGPASTYFTEGWPFPDYSESGARSKGYEFNSNGNTEGWTSSGGNLTSNNGLLTLNCSGVSSATLLSPSFKVDSFNSPMVEIDLRMTDFDNFANKSNFDNVYLYWTTSDSPDWSSDKCVDMKDWCTRTISNIPSQLATQTYWPMYLHPKWNGKTITQLKLVVTSKSTMNAAIKLNYVRMNYDSRVATTNGIYLSSVKNYYESTGDVQFLKNNLSRCRQALQFMLTDMDGSSGLIDQDWFTGHDGLQGVGHGINGSYSDITSLPSKNIEINMDFYDGVEAMAYIEKMVKELGISDPMPDIVGKDNKTLVTYNQSQDSLTSLANTIKTKFQQSFWDSKNGRFFAGYNNDNVKIDNGFVSYNLEAISDGLATSDQAQKVMSWINGSRIIVGDTSTGSDIYKNIFAPRFTTLKNTNSWVWCASCAALPFGDQVQDGGSILFVSYYDLLSRISALGTDNAFTRLKDIQSWYEDVASAGGEGDRFYRDYYDQLGIQLQGNGTSGGLGLDAEFTESALVYVAIPNGFFGYNVTDNKTIQFTPDLPSNLTYWKIENMMYNGIKYDVTIGKNSFIINAIRGNSVDGFSINVRFKKPANTYSVKVNGVNAKSQVIDGYVVVNIPFKNAVVTIN